MRAIQSTLKTCISSVENVVLLKSILLEITENKKINEMIIIQPNIEL